jgi:hypothetical protein
MRAIAFTEVSTDRRVIGRRKSDKAFLALLIFTAVTSAIVGVSVRYYFAAMEAAQIVLTHK